MQHLATSAPPKVDALARYLGRLYVEHWGRAVVIQNERVHASLDPTTGETGPNTLADIDLFVVALRNLLRAVQFALEETGSAEIAAAKAEFDQLVPAVEKVRNILEHFDEYLRGRGNLQRKHPELVGAPFYAASRSRVTDGGEGFTMLPSLAIVVGGEQISLESATRAAMQLSARVLQALSAKPAP